MGADTGSGLKKENHMETSEEKTRTAWFLILTGMEMQGSKAARFEEFHLKGWRVDAAAFADLENLMPTVIPLKPDGNMWPGSDGAKAEGQLKNWKTQLGGDVIYLMVPDQAQQGDNPWLIQPVKKEWLTMDSTHLHDRLVAFKDRPEELMVRAAIIARTGHPPE